MFVSCTVDAVRVDLPGRKSRFGLTKGDIRTHIFEEDVKGNCLRPVDPLSLVRHCSCRKDSSLGCFETRE